MKLSLESYYGRRYESGTKNPPQRPLTKRERDLLTKNCSKKCIAAYISRMTASGLVNPLDSIDDLKNEAWIAMGNIMDKFDKSKCGKITKFDVPGKSNPKSLEFYFLNYFYGRVNFMACDTRSEKKKRGMIGGKASNDDEVVYNPKDETADPAAALRYDSLKFLLEALKKQPLSVQALFEDMYVTGIPVNELKQKYPDYTKIRRSLSLFIKEFEGKHQGLLKEEVAGYKERRRGRRI